MCSVRLQISGYYDVAQVDIVDSIPADAVRITGCEYNTPVFLDFSGYKSVMCLFSPRVEQKRVDILTLAVDICAPVRSRHKFKNMAELS